MAGRDSDDEGEQRPLLQIPPGSFLPGPDDNKYDDAATLSETENAAGDVHPTRAIEDDVLPETSTLGRTLTWQSAYILVISRVIGSGIFATPGAILQSVGSPGLALLLWIVGTLVAAAGLAVSLEYGCMLPRSGGVKVYLEFTYRYPRLFATTQVAINAVFLGFTASNCVIFSRYVLFAFGVENASNLVGKGLAVVLLVAVTVIHAVTPKAGIKIQDFLGWIKVGIIIFMIFAGLYVVVFQPTLHTSTEKSPLSWDHLWDDSVWNWGVISTSLFKVFYAYAGLDNVSNVLNEVKDPVRTLRSVTLTALATSCAMYTLINVAYFIVVPIDEIKGSGELIAALFFQRVFGEQVGRKILPLAVALSAVGNVFVVAFAMVSRNPSTERFQLMLVIGTLKAGDCSTRLSALFRNPCFDKAVQFTPGRSHRQLHPLIPGDCAATNYGSVLLHPRSGRLSWPSLYACHGRWPCVATI